MDRKADRNNRRPHIFTENLENRVLLSVWAGTWNVRMSELGADSGHAIGDAYTDAYSITFTITDTGAGRYHLVAKNVKNGTFDLVDDPAQPGKGIMVDTFEPDPDDPASGRRQEEFMRLVMVDPGVVFLSVRGARYDSESRDSIHEMWVDGGLATKNKVPVTTPPWTGTYPAHSQWVTVRDSSNGTTAASTVDTQVSINPGAGRGTYSVQSANRATPTTFTLKSGKLTYATAKPGKLPLDAQYDAQMIFWGPYGRLYHLGIEANFSGSMITDGVLDASWTDPITNIAPALNKAASPFLSAISKDATSNPGTSVADLLASGGSNYVYDVNSGNTLGIALTGVDTAQGKWQYSLDGSNWLDVGKVSSSSALLLGPSARLRFVPKPGYTGTRSKAITFRAWDQSQGSNGGRANTSPSGKATAFSADTDTASLQVTL